MNEVQVRALTNIGKNMGEAILTLFLLLLMTAGCWFLVLNRGARDSMQRPASRLYKLNEEQKELWNAAYFAAVLVLALTFTIFFFVALVAAIKGT